MTRYLVIGMVTAIVIAHIFLWRSDMPLGAKVSFTLINAAGWGIILGPIFLVDRWLEAVQRRNAERKDHDNVT